MKFSVLIPTFNGGRYLAHTISSVLDQPDKDIELIISNNCSTDDTPNILRSFAEDPRIRVVRPENFLSVAENWNFALKASSGDYVLLIGDDDCLLPDYFKKIKKILAEYDYPEVVICNGYSYITPGSVDDNSKSFYMDPFYEFGSEFQKGLLSQKIRHNIVRDMFQFKVRFPLNIQPYLMSRKGIDRIKGDFFRPPFPDHYALNSLLLKAKTWLYYPEKLIVVGVAPSSCGFYVHNNNINGALNYLGIKIEDSNFLPGSMLINGMYAWLNLLKEDHKDQLSKIKVCRANYVRRQVYSWYLEYKAGAIKSKDILHRFRTLSLWDWIGLMTSIFDKASWERLGSLIGGKKDNQVQNIWLRAIQLDEVSDIKEFSNWISNRPEIKTKR